ncbi:MAG: phosphomannomutase/phosphoglucomutase [Methylacidiphilales bacterium]|nr:phosphomannomutase/phosphoglucomutase [Candidatus Methylacidiphilales bacterium]
MVILEKNNKLLRSIFRAYDIRGVVDELLTEELCYKIGLVFASQCAIKKIVVGFDGRLSSPRLSDALITGLQKGGMKVFSIGLVPTPILYFAIYYLGVANGIMITGSHNPVQYNGLKIVQDYKSYFQESIISLYHAIVNGDSSVNQSTLKSAQKSDIVSIDACAPYVARIVADIGTLRSIPVVLDPAHGATASIASSLFTSLGCDVHALYDTVDGTFPAHHPDPSKPENLKDLIHEVVSRKALVGIAFDGDGDRLGVVDELGRIIMLDDILALYCTEVLGQHPGASIVFDVKCSPSLERHIKQLTGIPVMSKTGHSYIKTEILKQHALLGGEMSGHVFFNDSWYGFDDGLYSAARLLKILSKENNSHVLLSIPERACTHEILVTMPEGDEIIFMEKFMQLADQFQPAQVNMLDGIRVEYQHCWGLVRASHTTPSIVMRFEGDTVDNLRWVQEKFKSVLLQVNPIIELPF